MRILLITQWFDPEPTFKGLLFARELQRLGHEVEVLTGFPNYPGGKLYPGYRVRPFQREVVQGVPVLRVPLYPSHDSSGVRRAANYLSFAASATVAGLFMRRPDVAYVYHPPATVGLPAMVLQALKGVPFVYDIQDLWPDTLAATGMMERQTVLNTVGSWMDRVYRRAAHIAVLSEGFKERLIERGVPERKLTVIPNWTDEAQIRVPEYDARRAAELGFTKRFNVVYAGAMGPAQALDTVLDAAALLGRDAPQVRFVLLGGGLEELSLRQEAQRRALGNVTFLDRRPPSEVGEILGFSDALLVHLKDDPLFTITIPSKTQAYLRTARPILIGVRGDAARMVEAAGAGYAFTPQDPQALADAVRDLLALPPDQRTKMGEAGRRYYDENLALRVGVRSFERLFERSVSAGSSYDPFKRLLDLTVASIALVVMSGPMVILAALVGRNLGRPVIFSQRRPGRHGQQFTMYKFRTMTDKRGPDGQLLPDAARLTRFGHLLRSSSLDELPELFNVLRGDMSLVGPRPLLMRYTPYFTPEEATRMNVRPGVTGWAQVNGRNTASWNERLAMDAWYVRRRSLILDLRILLLTVLKVFRQTGVVTDPSSTMLDLDVERQGNEGSSWSTG